MTYGKGSMKGFTKYTKAADLKQLEKELENLRQKRTSRRKVQHLFLPSPIGNDKGLNVEEGNVSQISHQNQTPTLGRATDKNLSLAVLKKKPGSSPILRSSIKHNNQQNITGTRTEQKHLPAKIITDLSKGAGIYTGRRTSSPTDHHIYAHEHSLLLQNLNLPTKAGRRKLNRLKSSAKSERILSDEKDDLTAELLRTAFQNLDNHSVPVRKSKCLNTDRLPSKIVMPAVSPGKRSNCRKQSSLSKLRTTKGKVVSLKSTAINAFENDTSTASEYTTNTLSHRKPLSKYILRPQNYDISSYTNTGTAPRSLSILNGNQLRSEPQPLKSKNYGDMEISHHTRLPAITTTPLNSIQESVYSNDVEQHYQPQISRNSVRRPLSIYTPQLSQLDSEYLNDLSSISPLSAPLAQYRSPIPETSISPQLLNTGPQHHSSPPTPPLQYSRSPTYHTPQKDNSADQPDALTDTPDNSIITTVSDNNNSSQQFYVFDIDNENTKSDILTHLEIDHLKNASNMDQPQANPQRYNDIHTDSSDDSSDIHLFDDADTDDMDENNNSGNNLNQPFTPQRKRYSDGVYFDHCYDYHINTTATTNNDMITAKCTQKPFELHEKVSSSSIETTPPAGSSSLQPTSLAIKNPVASTRRFWNAFSAEIGQQQRLGTTESKQLSSTNAPQSVKFLPTSLSQQQYNNISSTNSTLHISATSTPTRTLFRRRKSSNRPRNYDREKKESLSSSSWWKESSNKKPEPVYHTTVSLGKTPTSSSTSPFVNYAAKIGSKNPTGYRGSSSLTKRMIKAAPIAPAATAQPKWRQRVPVSKHYP
ncbi:hypothetical protein BCR42DRAFT_486802 [Absidia repens]|uniref:Uncharacterized protein n=1 Tax=Absidia repens TaxID=90262 RepID=A0A1X2IZ28_9FUNG|nr:hypothetical protein BCR42DRAFT_486802 [Absidia repens]